MTVFDCQDGFIADSGSALITTGGLDPAISSFSIIIIEAWCRVQYMRSCVRCRLGRQQGCVLVGTRGPAEVQGVCSDEANGGKDEAHLRSGDW